MKHFITLFLLSVSFSVNAQSLTAEQTRQVKIVVDAYKQNLIAYSISHDKDYTVLFDRIKSYFIPNPGDAHVMDFGDLDDGGAENVNLDTYLNKISEEYEGSIITTFTSGKILDCILKGENDQVAVYLLNKTMNYKSKIFVATNVILVTLPLKPKDGENYKIKSVQSATFFINTYKTYSCANMVEFRNSDREKTTILHEADTLLTNAKQPERALIKYIYLAERYPKDGYIRKQMDLCTSEIQDPNFLVKRGDSLLQTENFSQALYWYKWHQKLEIEKSDSTEVAAKIDSIVLKSKNTLYADAKSKAQKAYDEKNWPEARFFTEQALGYKPNDAFALDLLKNIKNYDETEYTKEIANASRMYSKDDKKNAGEYYRVLKKHDTYHPLTMIQYMQMCLILVTDRGFIKKGLKMTDDEIHADLKTYCKKLSDSLSTETNKRLLRTAEILLENVISFKI